MSIFQKYNISRLSSPFSFADYIPLVITYTHTHLTPVPSKPGCWTFLKAALSFNLWLPPVLTVFLRSYLCSSVCYHSADYSPWLCSFPTGVRADTPPSCEPLSFTRLGCMAVLLGMRLPTLLTLSHTGYPPMHHPYPTMCTTLWYSG